MSRRDEYVQKMKHQFDELNTQISELEAKGAAAQAEFKDKHQDQIAQVREHYHSALAKMAEVKDASEDKWESLVDEGEKLNKALVHSFNYFKSQMKK
jgi:chromosome segregation ATPase